MERKKTRPVLLAILDGWGEAPAGPGNAVSLAHTPNMDLWRKNCPFTTLEAHNGAVGLPEGQMGNSEVGHLNIGAGRVVYQDFTRIGLAVRQGDFFDNSVLNQTMRRVAEAGGALHLFGLLSDGGVHSHLDHLVALLELASRHGLGERVLVHAFMDGRDTPPHSGEGHMSALLEAMERLKVGRVATVCGRYYAMDRDQRWDRLSLAWEAVVEGRGRFVAADPLSAVREAYQRGESDEFIKPTLIVPDPEGGGEKGTPLIHDGDGGIFFNFRADRARQLTAALTDYNFKGFERRRLLFSAFSTMTRYDKDFDLAVAFPPQELRDILGEEISLQGFRQLRIAETEKYAHVTYFFNGGREKPFLGEDRALIASNREVATYDLKPEMSAPEVTEELLLRLKGRNVMDREWSEEERTGEFPDWSDKEGVEGCPYGFVVLNFANGDMVGHSGVLEAAIKACETVDSCMGRLVEAFTARGGIVLITADHGNAEEMIAPDGGPMTAHSCNLVPLILIDKKAPAGRYRLSRGGSLASLAPTVLQLMGLPIPGSMSGPGILSIEE